MIEEINQQTYWKKDFCWKFKCVLDHDSRHHRWLNSVIGYGNWTAQGWGIYFKNYEDATMFYITWIVA